MGHKNAAHFLGNRSKNFPLACLSVCLVASITFSGAAFAEDDEGESAPPPVKQPAASAPAKPAAESAPEEKKETKKEEKVKTGVIASQVNTGSFATVTVDADTSTEGGSPGEEANVISGSVIRQGNDRCIAKVINNGEKGYSISFVVEGTNPRGGKVLSQYFSATLKPKGSVEKSVSRCDRDLNLAVVLKSARATK